MQAKIEIDLGPLADEWEVVRVGSPRKGEQIVSGHMVLTAERDWAMNAAVIVRRKWVWPSWLKARWYCENEAGWQWVSNERPRFMIERDCWYHISSAAVTGFFDIPKIGGDWRQSLRENPNWKASPE